MLAKSLEAVLADLCRKGDFVDPDYPEMEKRFASLRGYGRLPRGRDDRARPLTDPQIAAAILAMTTPEPGWAGHAATVLGNLKLVGTPAAPAGADATLNAAVARLIGDPGHRSRLIAVRITGAESGTNASGFAEIAFLVGGQRQQAYFVPATAASLFQPEKEVGYDGQVRYRPFSREIALNRTFFDKLARKVSDARAYPAVPPGDGAEYDAEDRELVRQARLGVRPTSCFLNIGVDNQVTWPRTETLIEFDRYKLVLMPKTKEHVQSVHIDLHANSLTIEEAQTVINRFLSLLTWCDDQFAIAQDGWGGGHVPIAVSKRTLAFSTNYRWLFNRSMPATDEARRALALYREARNAEQNFMVSYAVLNYYKVIEIRYPKGPDARDWIARNFPPIRNRSNYKPEIAKFLAACGSDSPERYIYKACRVAIAHASDQYPSDPDDTAELHRLHNAADVMRLLARQFISAELGVSDSPFELVQQQDA